MSFDNVVCNVVNPFKGTPSERASQLTVFIKPEENIGKTSYHDDVPYEVQKKWKQREIPGHGLCFSRQLVGEKAFIETAVGAGTWENPATYYLLHDGSGKGSMLHPYVKGFNDKQTASPEPQARKISAKELAEEAVEKAVNRVKRGEVVDLDLTTDTGVCIHWISDNGKDYIVVNYITKNWQGQWREHYTDVYDSSREYLGVWGYLEDE